jgi:hypothetical protein
MAEKTPFPIHEHKAKRVACKAAVMIQGLPGDGKSGVALAMAFVLAGGKWEDITVADTENASVQLFAGLHNIDGEIIGEFNIIDLDATIGFKPSNYLAIKEYVISQGRKVLIEDSISHAWQYSGGVLELVNKAKKTLKNPNDTYAAWGDETVMTEKNQLLEMIRDRRIHVITTVRVKEKYEYEEEALPSGGTKKKLVSLGEQQIQQGDLKFEPDLVLDMIEPANTMDYPEITFPKVKVLKSRYAIFKKNEEYIITPELLGQLKSYLEDGTSPDELLEQQRLDYIQAVKEYLDIKGKGAVAVWKELKKQAGIEDVALEKIPLNVLKQLYVTLTM